MELLVIYAQLLLLRRQGKEELDLLLDSRMLETNSFAKLLKKLGTYT